MPRLAVVACGTAQQQLKEDRTCGRRRSSERASHVAAVVRELGVVEGPMCGMEPNSKSGGGLHYADGRASAKSRHDFRFKRPMSRSATRGRLGSLHYENSTPSRRVP